MKISDRNAARIAGTLILLGIVAGLLSISPSVEGEHYLTEVYADRIQVYSAVVFQFLLIPIYVGYSLVLYPLLKRYSESLSLGFVGFRTVAATFQLIGVLLLPVFVLLSQQYTTTPPAYLPLYHSAGGILRLIRDLTNHVGVVMATGLGNLIFYLILYRAQLIPRWITVWGILGNSLIMLAGLFLAFQYISVISTAYGLMSIPLVLQELILALWLLSKGLLKRQ